MFYSLSKLCQRRFTVEFLTPTNRKGHIGLKVKTELYGLNLTETDSVKTFVTLMLNPFLYRPLFLFSLRMCCDFCINMFSVSHRFLM